MYYRLTLVAVGDNDPACNLYTLTETHYFSAHEPPTEEAIREKLREHKDKFLESWPHRGTRKPTLVPLRAELIVKGGRRPA